MSDLKVNVAQADGRITLTLFKKELLALTPEEMTSATPIEKLENIAKLASEACHKLRFNNSLWADAANLKLEAALIDAGLYVPPPVNK